jgi:chemotaxis protein histidine kinase CheA
MQSAESTKSSKSTEQQTPSSTEQQTPSSTEQQTPSSTEQQTPSSTDVNAKTLTQLNTLMEESLQIYELEDQKTNVINDLQNALQVITEFLGFSTNVHPSIFNLPSNATITMLPNLKLIIKLVNGKTETKKFSDYAPEVITQIVEYVTPQLLELIKVQKSYLTEKITFLRTATKQLNTISQLKENLPSGLVPKEE